MTDDVIVVEISGQRAVILNQETGFAELLGEPEREAAEVIGPSSEREVVVSFEQGMPPHFASHGAESVALRSQGIMNSLIPRPRYVSDFALEPPDEAGASRVRHGSRHQAYRLRDDIAFPRALAREVMPRSMTDLVSCIARRVDLDAEAVALMQKTRGHVTITEEDLFEGSRKSAHSTAPISAARIALGAQQAFRFNEDISERDLKPLLCLRFKQELDKRGFASDDEKAIRRTIDLLAMSRPHLLTDACRSCLATVVQILQDEEIPSIYYGPHGLEPAEKSLYGIFPHDMNREEEAFARILDEDPSGTVLWWLRNVSRARWAVSIVLPTGERHYPDFVVGVDARRAVTDHVALVEVKDDGTTGRLFAERTQKR